MGGRINSDIEDGICIICSRPYIKQRENQNCCSRKCKDTDFNRNRRVKPKKEESPTYVPPKESSKE